VKRGCDLLDGIRRKIPVGCQAAFAAMRRSDKPTPTGDWCKALAFHQTGRALTRLAFCFCFCFCFLLFAVFAPLERTEARACRATARHRTTGARALGYLGPGGVPLLQVTRRKGETISGRDLNNGYVHPNSQRRITDHRERADLA
jgi:hypothetical protein